MRSTVLSKVSSRMSFRTTKAGLLTVMVLVVMTLCALDLSIITMKVVTRVVKMTINRIGCWVWWGMKVLMRILMMVVIVMTTTGVRV